MKKMLALSAFLTIMAAVSCSLSFAQTIDIANLVDSFQNATDLQKEQILKDTLGKEISASGTVSNAGEYDFFDTVNDVQGTYFQVSTEGQKTKKNTPFQAIFLFKDKETAKGVSKGQNIEKSGPIVRILDERLQISVWIFCGELTAADKSILNKNL